MQFYDATNLRAISQEIDRLCDTTDTSYPRAQKTARVNDALETVVGWIITADGTWQFDDENFTTLPLARYTLTSGQHSYAFNDKFLAVEEMQILPASGGLFRQLKPIDSDDLGGVSFEEYFGITVSGSTFTAPSGLPEYYDKQANNIKFDKAPTATYVTLDNGLRVRFKRTGSLFTVATDTAADATVPGFASPFHVILAWMGARPYVATYHPNRVAMLDKWIGDTTPTPTGMKKDILKFYARRQLDKRPIMSMKKTNIL